VTSSAINSFRPLQATEAKGCGYVDGAMVNTEQRDEVILQDEFQNLMYLLSQRLTSGIIFTKIPPAVLLAYSETNKQRENLG